ncbi:hypothetical protein JMJ56_07525 [Belnapia sp. T18]|uniref:DUF3592 domain-containing protein n=1 Tax=Belnapia arida TaxID=2804533 RepID=A0ABS1TZL1_9PROT|nr:hypothetical protein [Belnapia arida]MBL6077849.1 hypothetical protein [Belnapia arida]
MSLAQVADVFPDRSLVLKAPVTRWRGWLSACVLFLLCAGFAGWAAIGLVPALAEDYALRNSAVPINGRVLNGQCRSRLALLQDCEMTLVANATRKGAGPLRQKVSYLFVEPHVGDFQVQVMADPARPDRLTTDMGLGHLTNRLLTGLGIAVALVGLFLGGIVLVRASGRARRDMANLSGRRLAPVPVQVTRDTNGWQVRPTDGKRPALWPLPRKAEPFWLDGTGPIALGVTAPGGALFPLDRDLAWANFTPQERDRLRVAAGYSAPLSAGAAPSAAATAA